MKKILILLALLQISIQSFSQAPSPPHKICYSYDVAGNRVKQDPGWLVNLSHPDYGLNCSAVEDLVANYGINIIKISHISQLEELHGALTDIRWVLPIGDVPISVLSGVTSVYTWPSNYVSLNPNLPYAVIWESLPPAAPPIPPASPPQQIEVNIVPNPTEGRFKVDQLGFNIDKAEILIVSMQGAILFKREFVSGEVNVSEYPSGEYLLILRDEINSKTVRFMKK